MSELRIIPVTFGSERTTVTDYRIQHDWGQVYKFLDIDLPDVFEARFSNAPKGESVPQIGKDNMVEIPAQFFESGAPIYCYITLHDEETDGRTYYTVKTPISPSSDRTDAEPEPEEESIITQAITAINTAVDTTTQKAQEATESADRAEQAAEGVESYAERAESAQTAAESARDIALEAKVSAQASAVTASEKASEAYNYADVANKAYIATERYASIAEGEAGEAKRYAEASAESASQANGYASTAGSKATEASGYASNANISAETASQKASEAAQSASTAVQAKTDAITAKTASETAQGLAESARDGAVSAKTGAESARDEAQSIADGITGKVEQIDSNTDRIESLEDDRYKPYPTDTASGSIASFTDGADDIPLKSCIVQIEPVQDMHGYSNPWPSGGGENLLDLSSATENTVYGFTVTKNDNTGVVTIAGAYSGTMVNASFAFLLNVPYIADTKVIAFDMNASLQEHILYQSAPVRWGNTTNGNLAIDLKGLEQGATYNFTLRLLVCSNSVTPTSWTPYANICPISGFDGLTVWDTGKNMINPSELVYSAGGNIVWYGIHLPPDTDFVFSTDSIITGLYVTYSDDDEMPSISGAGWDNITYKYNTTSLRFNSGSHKWYRLMTYEINDVIRDRLYQLELGSTATAYEPYQGETYDITFPTEAGTIYGGYVDVINGELVVDRAQIASYNGETLPSTWISDRDVYTSGTTPTIGAQVVYKLAEPIHYPLTAIDIKTLLGTNNIWADTGDVSVEYRADTTLYISKKISEALASLT